MRRTGRTKIKKGVPEQETGKSRRATGELSLDGRLKVFKKKQ